MPRLVAMLAGLCCALVATPDDARQERQSGGDARRKVTAIVAQIQRADYEGDRAALRRLNDELMPFVGEQSAAQARSGGASSAQASVVPGGRSGGQSGAQAGAPSDAFAARVLYWRGFALWRRAFNGFNEPGGTNKADVDADLLAAAAEMHDAATRDPAFADAKVGEASCLVNSAFFHIGTPEGTERFLRSVKILGEAAALAPDNPRLLWVRGANEWYAPAARGGGQDIALATYARGLELARRRSGRQPPAQTRGEPREQHREQRELLQQGGQGPSTDPLEPAWGEPELLMNLAWANLHRSTPDLAAAERYAQEALALVPYWHYVRDVLVPQIREAKAHPQAQ